MTAIPLADLRGLAGVYFGQEWNEIASTPAGLVAAFVSQQGKDGRTRALAQIDTAMASHPDEAHLAELWSQTLGSAFRVPPTGMTYRQWFEHLRDLLLEATPAGS